MAINKAGLVFVADRNTPPPGVPLPMLVTGRIQVFREKDGKFLYGFNRTKGLGSLDVPASVAINPKNGNLFIADIGKNASSVYEFTAKGKFVRELEPPRGVGMDWSPAAVAFDRKGNLYVLDVGKKQRVIVFDGTSRLRRIFGSTGSADGPEDKPGELWYPTALAVADNGWVFVSDTQNSRIQVFDENGEFRKIIYTGGAPMGIAVTPGGLIIVGDSYNHVLALYTQDGKAKQQYGQKGFKRAQFAALAGIALDPKTGWVFVADPENNRVDAWAPKAP